MVTRRGVIAAALAAAAASVSCAPRGEHAASAKKKAQAMSNDRSRMPAVYLPHGGGPWPFVDLGGFLDPREIRALADYLSRLPEQLPRRPTGMVVVSAHWEAKVPTVMTAPRPPILYDYYGFPPESYEITWPAPGDPKLAARVRTLLEGAGVPTAEDARRGFDHGTFIPLKLTFPDADVPTIQLSLEEGLDPVRHLAIGRALAPLRDEGVLLVGSGMSYHNLRMFGRPEARADAEAFDVWMQHAAVAEPAARDSELTRWAAAPAARRAHPREEHLLPLMVMAGAAGTDRGRVTYSDTFAGARISAVQFGA
jgi:aromatic ring-opening dioxygenase catalytic subunit (LigB family)